MGSNANSASPEPQNAGQGERTVLDRVESDRVGLDHLEKGHPKAWVPLSRWITYFSIVAVGSIADLTSKHLIFAWRGWPNEQAPWWLIDGILGIETALNHGAVFGIGAGQGNVFAALSIVAGIGVLTWLFVFGAARSWWMCVSLGLVSGGIIGNLHDRLGLWWHDGLPGDWNGGVVRDWILMQAGDAYKWPNYNIADSLLVIGAGMLVWHSFFPGGESTKESDAPQAVDGDPQH